MLGLVVVNLLRAAAAAFRRLVEIRSGVIGRRRGFPARRPFLRRRHRRPHRTGGAVVLGCLRPVGYRFRRLVHDALLSD
jgi:hypothetical protein